MPGCLCPPLPVPTGWDPALGAPRPSPSPHAWGTHVALWGARAAATESVHPRPQDAAFWGQSRFFGARQTIALCISPRCRQTHLLAPQLCPVNFHGVITS